MKITIRAASKTYPVIVAKKALSEFVFPTDRVVVTDAAVFKLLPAKLRKRVIVLPTGEEHKRLATIERAAEQLVTLGATKTTGIVAIGGGVVGDMAGLLASLYMRGVQLYHVPTTLLAMVDSSIGGKNGVDVPSGKNILGTFSQPEAVLIDPAFLQKLPADQFANGMAEVIKHGVIDGALFAWLEKKREAIQARDIATLEQMLIKNVRIKKQIVEQDERENLLRMKLNLGHTFGHAIEQVSGYAIPHGEAVAIGLHYACRFAAEQNGFDEVDRVVDVLHSFNLPTEVVPGFAPSKLVQAMLADKKRRGSGITLVLPKSIGKVEIQADITAKKIEQFFTQLHA